MKILIVNDSAETSPEEFLTQTVGSLSSELSKRNLITEEKNRLELSVVFLDEKDAKRINWQYRSKDYATDVLSFETDDPESLGELVMCPQVLKKQASENKLSYEHEVFRMMVHGVLHLLGFDHERSPEEEKKMLDLQEQILNTILHPEPAKRHLKLIKPATKKTAPKASAKPTAKSPKGKLKVIAKTTSKSKSKTSSANAKKSKTSTKSKKK